MLQHMKLALIFQAFAFIFNRYCGEMMPGELRGVKVSKRVYDKDPNHIYMYKSDETDVIKTAVIHRNKAKRSNKNEMLALRQ